MQLLSTADISRFLLAATLLLAPALSAAAEPSATDLRRMEEQVAKQTAESERLAQEAKQINQEIDTISRKMIRYANLIQNNEEKISSMETELQQLQTELNAAEAEFSLEDENLIKTLAALQNLALKPTESLFVQPLTPVEIIRSAMLLRETVPYLEQNAQRIKIKLEQIDKQKQKVETQFNKIVAQKKLLEQEHDELAALSKKKSTLRNSIEQQSAAAKKKVSKLASQAQDLRDLLGKLEAERLKKQQEEERRRVRREHYYGPDANSRTHRTRRRHLYIFSPEDLDNAEVMAMVENSPTYLRDKATLNAIKAKSEEQGKQAAQEGNTEDGGIISFV